MGTKVKVTGDKVVIEHGIMVLVLDKAEAVVLAAKIKGAVNEAAANGVK